MKKRKTVHITFTHAELAYASRMRRRWVHLDGVPGEAKNVRAWANGQPVEVRRGEAGWEYEVLEEFWAE